MELQHSTSLKHAGFDARVSQAYATAVGRVDQRNFRRQRVDIADSMSAGQRTHAWSIGGKFGPPKAAAEIEMPMPQGSA